MGHPEFVIRFGNYPTLHPTTPTAGVVGTPVLAREKPRTGMGHPEFVIRFGNYPTLHPTTPTAGVVGTPVPAREKLRTRMGHPFHWRMKTILAREMKRTHSDGWCVESAGR
jgi:hypothetical protein